MQPRILSRRPTVTMLRQKSHSFLLLAKPTKAHYTTQATHSSPPLIHIPNSKVYRFGDSNSARPIFHELDWTVREGESWAVVGSGSGEKTALLEVCTSFSYLHTRPCHVLSRSDSHRALSHRAPSSRWPVPSLYIPKPRSVSPVA